MLTCLVDGLVEPRCSKKIVWGLMSGATSGGLAGGRDHSLHPYAAMPALPAPPSNMALL